MRVCLCLCLCGGVSVCLAGCLSDYQAVDENASVKTIFCCVW